MTDEILINGPAIELGRKNWPLRSRKGHILGLLATGAWFSRQELVDLVFGVPCFYANPFGLLSVLINDLRNDLQDTDYSILTKHGGYLLVEPPQVALAFK